MVSIFFNFFYKFTKIKMKILEHSKSIRNNKRNNAWNIRPLVDNSFVPVNQLTSVLYCRLSDFTTTHKKLSTVSFYRQAIHKKFLRRFGNILGLNMMVKSGLENIILQFHGGLQRYLLTRQPNSAFLGRFFCSGQQQL